MTVELVLTWVWCSKKIVQNLCRFTHNKFRTKADLRNKLGIGGIQNPIMNSLNGRDIKELAKGKRWPLNSTNDLQNLNKNWFSTYIRFSPTFKDKSSFIKVWWKTYFYLKTLFLVFLKFGLKVSKSLSQSKVELGTRFEETQGTIRRRKITAVP